MDQAQIKSDVYGIVSSLLGKKADEISDESRFIEDLGADSLDSVELIMELEKKFQVSMPDDKSASIKTVGEAITQIQEHLESQGK